MALVFLPLLRRLLGGALLIGALSLAIGTAQASSFTAASRDTGFVSQLVALHAASGSARPATGQGADLDCPVAACSSTSVGLHLPVGVHPPVRTIGRLPLPGVGALRTAVLTGDPPVPRHPA